ncbi:MAG: M14 family metallopeptidase [Bacteroidota bacterium]
MSLLFLGPSLWAQATFEFEGQKILPGTKAHLKIPIKDKENETFLPITIFHGKENGPVVGITAGVHGYEYAPILAGQQLIGQIDPQKLKGTVVLVQVANIASFLGRSPYINPLDRKNLNRSFPGNADGSITERIADFISQKIIPRSDYFLDVHSGDAPEDLMPYAAYYQHDDKVNISQKGREIASHLGFDHIVVFRTTGKEYMQKGKPSLYCSAEAFKQGIPAADIECGRLGIIEQETVEKIVRAVKSMLSHLQMTSGDLVKTKGLLFIDKRTYMSSGHTGFFYSMKSSGDYVRKGMQIGYVTNFFNETVEEVYAETSGIILYMLGTPPVNKGETLVAIGEVD